MHDATGRYSWAEALSLALGAGRGINHLHAATPPIVHRDLKSANLLISGGQGSRVIKVRKRLCLVCSTAFVAKTLPLPCVFHCLRG